MARLFKEKLLNTKCVHLLSETCLILRINERDVIKNVCRSSCKVPTILCIVLLLCSIVAGTRRTCWREPVRVTDTAGPRHVTMIAAKH